MAGFGLGRVYLFTALQQRDYRWLWLNIFCYSMGRWMEWVALSWMLLELGASPFLLGVAYACRIAPTAFFGALAGALADTLGRRKPMLIAQSVMVSLQWLTASLFITDIIQVWHILAIALLGGTAMAFDQPARQAMVFDLVGKRELLNAVALNRIAQRSALIAGAPIAGGLIGAIGIGGSLYVIGAIFLMGVLALLMLQPPAMVIKQGKESVWRNLASGLAYVRGQRHIMALLAVEITFDVFATAYHVLMPIFARDILKVGATGLGFLYAAEGVGEMAGALTLASLGNLRRRGWLLLGGLLGLGAWLLLFSLSSWYVISLLVLAATGVMHTTVMIMLQTLLQSNVPDELRGRVMGIYVLTWGAVPLGSLQAGALATWLGAPFAVGIGGIMIILVATGLLTTQPKVRRLE